MANPVTNAEHRTYGITITSVATSIYNLLSNTDAAEYNAIISGGLVIQPLFNPAQNKEVRYRTPSSGYVVAVSGAFSALAAVSGSKELVTAPVHYDCPVYFFPNKVWLSSTVPTMANVRIYFN